MKTTLALPSGGKLRSDSKLGALTPEQRAKVDQWLFEENLSHRVVMERCKKDFNLELSRPSVQRYCRKERIAWELRQHTRADVAAMQGQFPRISEPEARYRVLLIKLGEFVLEKAEDLDRKENRALVTDLTKLLIAARREASIAQRGALARQKFEFDAATECLKHQIEVQAIMQNKELNDGNRVDQIRRELFGNNLPK